MRPRRRLAASLAQDPFADRNDEAALFGRWNKCAGSNEPAARMIPSHQRLEPDDAPVDQGLRLVVQSKLLEVYRSPQIPLERAPVARALVHLGGEEPDSAGALDLRTTHGSIRIPDQRFDLRAVGREDRHSDAQRHPKLATFGLDFIG